MRHVVPTVKVLNSTLNFALQSYIDSRKELIMEDGEDLILEEVRASYTDKILPYKWNTRVEEGDKILFTGAQYKRSEYDKLLYNMNLQYMDIGQIIFEFYAPMYFRDFCYQYEGTGKWATSTRASRCIETGEVEFCSWNKDEELVNNYLVQLEKYNCKECSFDELKNSVPLTTMTTFQWAVPARTFNLVLRNLRDMGGIFEVYRNMFKELPALESWIANTNLDYIPQYIADMNKFDETGVEVEVGGNIFAQLIRQSFTRVGGYNEFLTKTQGNYSGVEAIKCSIKQPKEQLLHNLKNRLCWFSMSDGEGINSWSTLYGKYLEAIPKEDWKDLLPCCKGECKFAADISSRTSDDTRYVPCAIKFHDRSFIEKRRAQYGDSPFLRFYDYIMNEGLDKVYFKK